MVSFYRNTKNIENSADNVLKLILNALAVLFWKAFSSVRKESVTITHRATFPRFAGSVFTTSLWTQHIVTMYGPSL